MGKQRTPARPTDVNQLAKRIVEISTGEVGDNAPAPISEKASKRGRARAEKLTPAERRAIARKAAAAS